MKKQNKFFILLFIGFLFFPYSENKKVTIRTQSNQNVLALATEKKSKISIKQLAVFIRFSDSNQNVLHHLDDQESVLNAYKLFNSEEAIEMESVKGKVYVPSFKTYYERESYGDVSITTEIFPQVQDKVISYTDIHPIGYYLRYSDTNPIGYKTNVELLQRETELINKATSYIENMVVTSGIKEEELDSNGDGVIDAITFIIEGQENLPSSIAFNDLLWSHMRNNTAVTNTILGKRASIYTFLYATDYKEAAGLFSLNRGTYGTIIHEFGHTLGYMDLYRHGNNTSPVGFYDIMGNTIGSNPQSFLTYFTSEYHKNTNWHNPLPVINKTTTDITLSKPKFKDKNEQRAIKIEVGGNKDEYFVLEYHAKMNTYDTYSAESSGVIIYRVNEKYKFQGNNGTGDHIYIFRPNETGLNAGEGDLSLATLNKKRPTFGKELDLKNNQFDKDSIFFSDGVNSGIIIEVTKETIDSITVNVTYPKTEGEGTKDNPYLIRDTENYLYLMGISTTDKYYKLMNDLDFTGINYPSIIFEGNLDGNNKVLKNIISKKTGVFQTVGNYQTKTTIKNLTIENINATSNTGFTLGGFANNAENVELYNIHVKSGSIIQERMPIYDLETTGGFLGSAENNVQISSCSSNVTVKGKQSIGGFIGLNKNAKIKDSFAAGFVIGTNNTGGFIGLQLIMDTVYHTPENVYFDGNKIANAVGGYDKTFHNLSVLSEENLAKGIHKVTIPNTFSLTQYTQKELPLTITPNAIVPYQITMDTPNLVSVQNGKLEGLNVGTTSLALELNIGTGKMPFTMQITVMASSTALTEKEVLTFLGLTKKENYVVGFSLGTNILDIKRKIASDTRIQLKSFKNANHIELQEGIVATGMQFTLFFNNTDYTYTIIIKGDVNGDGVIYATDYVKVKNHIMGKTTLYGAYLMAADINNDGNIYATDYVQIKNHIMEKKSILQTF